MNDAPLAGGVRGALRSGAMKRDAAQTIFRTVVFAGAMLGAGCGKKAAPVAPMPDNSANDPAPTQPADPADPSTDTAMPDDPCAGGDPCADADPCGGERPRGSDDEDPCGGGMGRGFILS